MKILIVDDHPVNRRLLRSLLAAEGMESVEAGDGREALAVLSRERVDCVVTDILMPEMDGYELCQRIRSDPALNPLPVIIYTATYVSPQDQEVAVEIGADCYIGKPAPAADIAAAIRRLTTQTKEKKRQPVADVVLKQYNETLIRKLEEGNQRLREEARKLAESEEKFRQLTSSIQEVFFMTDAEGAQMLYVSPAYEAVWGRSCQSLYASPRDWSDAIHPEDRDAALKAVAERTAAGAPYELECRIIRPDGTPRWIRVRLFPIKDAAGRVYRLSGAAADVTEQKSLLDQFLQAQKMEAIGRLAGGVAHDFNNLLTAILGLSELSMAALPADHPLAGDLAEIRATGQRAAVLTQQLLAFSRRQVFEPRTMDLNAVVSSAEKMLARVIGENVELLVRRAPAELPARVDPGQMEQVLVNLCVNARDAMPKGGKITVTTALADVREAFGAGQDRVEPGRYVTLSVADEGAGLDPDARRHLFEPFFTTKPVGKGTGLGLATCYGIVKQSGGAIRVDGAPGGGTTFTVYLPPAKDLGPGPEEASVRGGDDRGRGTILVVEDETSVRKLACRILREKGYAVLEGADGFEGLRRVEEDSERAIRLVVTDVIMPMMNGKVLSDELRRIRSDVKILFTSGYPDDTLSHEGVLDSGIAFLRKPFSIRSLTEKVRELLDAPGRQGG